MILSQLLLIQILSFARTVLVVDVEEFVCQEGNGFLSFKDVCPVTRDEGIAEAYAFDSASDGSCRIALSSMVGGNDDGFERIIYGNGAVDGNRQCFFCIRSVAKDAMESMWSHTPVFPAGRLSACWRAADMRDRIGSVLCIFVRMDSA